MLLVAIPFLILPSHIHRHASWEDSAAKVARGRIGDGYISTHTYIAIIWHLGLEDHGSLL